MWTGSVARISLTKFLANRTNGANLLTITGGHAIAHWMG
jgi:hypothetical protein